MIAVSSIFLIFTGMSDTIMFPMEPTIILTSRPIRLNVKVYPQQGESEEFGLGDNGDESDDDNDRLVNSDSRERLDGGAADMNGYEMEVESDALFEVQKYNVERDVYSDEVDALIFKFNLKSKNGK